MSSAHRPAPVAARRFVVAITINLALVIGEIVGASIAHSSSLLADAGHNIADLAVLGLGFAAVHLALRKPTSSRSFGFHRSSILAGVANLGIVAIVTVLVALEAISHLDHPPAVHGTTVAIVAAIAVLANGVSAAVLSGSHDLNRRVVVLHLVGDALSSLAVLTVGVIIATTGRFAVLDPAASLGIALLVALSGVRLARESVDILLESTPTDIDLATLSEAIRSVPNVVEVHDLHCWSLSTEVRALSAHVVLSGQPSLEAAQSVGEQIKAAIRVDFGIAHTTLELESDHCSLVGDIACSIDTEYLIGVEHDH